MRPDGAVAFPGVPLIFALIPSIMVMAAIETPCKSACVFNPAVGVCVGCGRTLEEIGSWSALPATERARIMADLPRRLAALRRRRPAETAV
jgi:predicted Fe-S protein YdhL (DUF1289 family)